LSPLINRDNIRDALIAVAIGGAYRAGVEQLRDSTGNGDISRFLFATLQLLGRATSHECNTN